MNNGYNPTTPITNQQMPEWARYTVDADQLRLDMEYLHGSGNSLDHYYAAAAAWVATETQLRAASADPEHYRPVTPLPTIPARQVEDYIDEKGFFTRPEIDPTIPVPALAPYVKPVVAPPWTTGAQKEQEIILNMLTQALKDLAIIKAALAAAATDGKQK